MHDQLVRLFTARFGGKPHAILEIAGDGSQRTYFRLVGDAMETAVGAIGPDHEENRAFLSFTNAFRSIGLPVPAILGVDEAAGVWLEEDLGDTTLFHALSSARDVAGGAFPTAIVPAYERVIEVLPRFQVEGGAVIDYGVAYPRAAFDLQSIAWDLNYFKYHFLKLAQIPFNEERLENDFRHLSDFLLHADTRYFLYRDFQSRNVMLRDGEPWFIDYQGGRRGALHYDIASLLYDAKAAIPDTVRDHLLEHYMDVLEDHVEVHREEFRQTFRGYVLVRIMQAMGAYGYRGFFERKPRFLQSVPYAASNLERIIAYGLPVRLPELECVFNRIVDAWAHRAGPVTPLPGLTVNIMSFSYRRGYPDEGSDHGGGFVFDCRALPNPGRHLEYAGLSGLDAAVVEYIENTAEVGRFFEHASALIDAQVKEYLRRGFTSLTVGFGCTGGQHRSVYLAERLARHLRARFTHIAVVTDHRERQRWPEGGVRDEIDAATPDVDPAGDVAGGAAGAPPVPGEAASASRRGAVRAPTH